MGVARAALAWRTASLMRRAPRATWSGRPEMTAFVIPELSAVNLIRAEEVPSILLTVWPFKPFKAGIKAEGTCRTDVVDIVQQRSERKQGSSVIAK